MTLPANFLDKTRIPTDCIVWTAAVNGKGYACIGVDGRSQLAHRVAWEAERGPIPEAMTLDHLCRVRNCVNVEHLEVVSIAENLARRPRAITVGQACRNGHSILSDQDYYTRRNGVRECRECMRSAKARCYRVVP